MSGTFTVAEIEQAIEAVAEQTGTARAQVRVEFSGEDGEWYWTVRAPVRTFATPTGKRKHGLGYMMLCGTGTTPMGAAKDCVDRVRSAVEEGRGITGGRIEVYR